MDKHLPPQRVAPSLSNASTLPPVPPVSPRPTTGVDGEGLSRYRSSYWSEQPSPARRFAPVLVIGALAAAAIVAMNVDFSGERSEPALAQGPAVEQMIENAPPAAGPAAAASAAEGAAPPVPAAPEATTPKPAATPPVTREVAPALPSSNARASRSVPVPRPDDTRVIPVPQPRLAEPSPSPSPSELRDLAPASPSPGLTPPITPPAILADTPTPSPVPLPTPTPLPAPEGATGSPGSLPVN